MRKAILLAGLVLAVVVLLPGNGFSAAGGSNLPLKGTASGTFTVNLATGQAHILGTGGQLTHLGLWTSEQDAQLIPTGPGMFHEFFTATGTAANGDQMFSSGVGDEVTDGVHGTITANYVSTGGTGRFVDASWSFAVIVHTTLVSVVGVTGTGTWEGTFDGQLSWSEMARSGRA